MHLDAGDMSQHTYLHSQHTSSATLWSLNIYHFPISSITREISLFRENTNWQVKILKKKHVLRKVWNNRRFHHLFSDGSTGTVIQILKPATFLHGNGQSLAQHEALSTWDKSVTRLRIA
jgi:hypothetical protein